MSQITDLNWRRLRKDAAAAAAAAAGVVVVVVVVVGCCYFNSPGVVFQRLQGNLGNFSSLTQAWTRLDLLPGMRNVWVTQAADAWWLLILMILMIPFGFKTNVGVSQNRGIPKWMVKIMENPIKMDDLGVPLFSETSMFNWRKKGYSRWFLLKNTLKWFQDFFKNTLSSWVFWTMSSHAIVW